MARSTLFSILLFDTSAYTLPSFEAHIDHPHGAHDGHQRPFSLSWEDTLAGAWVASRHGDDSADRHDRHRGCRLARHHVRMSKCDEMYRCSASLSSGCVEFPLRTYRTFQLPLLTHTTLGAAGTRSTHTRVPSIGGNSIPTRTHRSAPMPLFSKVHYTPVCIGPTSR